MDSGAADSHLPTANRGGGCNPSRQRSGCIRTSGRAHLQHTTVLLNLWYFFTVSLKIMLWYISCQAISDTLNKNTYLYVVTVFYVLHNWFFANIYAWFRSCFCIYFSRVHISFREHYARFTSCIFAQIFASLHFRAYSAAFWMSGLLANFAVVPLFISVISWREIILPCPVGSQSFSRLESRFHWYVQGLGRENT